MVGVGSEDRRPQVPAHPALPPRLSGHVGAGGGGPWEGLGGDWSLPFNPAFCKSIGPRGGLSLQRGACGSAFTGEEDLSSERLPTSEHELLLSVGLVAGRFQ